MSKKVDSYKTTIGGQAIIEGIVMKGPRKSCTVVRKPDDELAIKEKETIPPKEKNFILGLPVIRGVYGFGLSLKDGMEAIDYSSKFIEDDEEPSRFEKWLEKKLGSEKLEKVIFSIALFFGVAIPVVLFFMLPTILAGFIPVNVMPNMARNILEGIIRIVIFLTFMFVVSKMKDIERTYRYHGAEHKTIYCYEKGLDLTVDNVREQSRFHPRCGTSFLFVVMIISILIFSVVTWSSPVERMLIRLALLPLVVGISYEINRFAGRHDNIFTNVLRAPGLLLQRLSVFEPDDSMIEVAIQALKRVIPENKGEDRW